MTSFKTWMAQHFVAPLSRRLATLASGWLIAQGVEPELINQIMLGMTASVLVGIDLLLSAVDKKGRD